MDDPPAEPLMDPTERHREERRAVEEAGGGEAEGFELAEQDLIEHASHGDQHTPDRILQDAGARGGVGRLGLRRGRLRAPRRLTPSA